MVKKRELDRFCRWTGNRRESVPPRPEAPASTQIFVSDIHSTDECQLAIDDYDFSMIPEVDLKPKTEPTAGFERLSVDSTPPQLDRKSTRLNSSHQIISYAVFCLKKKKKKIKSTTV